MTTLPVSPFSPFPSSAPSTAARLRGGAAALCASAFALSLAMLAAPAHAVVGTNDNQPAATLLLPYFEVDVSFNNTSRIRTSFTVVNTIRTPTLAHVTLWTDYAVPTYSFDLYLGGRDSVEVDLNLLFNEGILPKTAPSIGSAGPASFPHAAIASCTNILPPPDAIPVGTLGHLQAAHTGGASQTWGNQCGGANIGDSIARGYITIDQSNSCSALMPNNPGYFVANGQGVAGNLNILVGESKHVNPTTRLAITEPLVAIEADSNSAVTNKYDLNPTGNPAHDIRTAYTFYGRFVANAADQREPLGSIYATRFQSVQPFPTPSTITVWRDFDRSPGQAGLPFACASPPSPMPTRKNIMFDDQERFFYPGGQAGVPYNKPQPGFEPNIFPRATQRVSTTLMNAPTIGWAYFDLNNGDLANSYFNGARQGFVSVQMASSGKYGGSLNAHQLWNVGEWALKAAATPNAITTLTFPSIGF